MHHAKLTHVDTGKKVVISPLLNAMGVNAQGATSDKIVACRVASNYPFAKLMEIAESVPTGCV